MQMQKRMQEMQMFLMQTYLALNYANVNMKESYRIKIVVYILGTLSKLLFDGLH